MSEFRQFDRINYWARPENAPRLSFMTQGEKIQIDMSTQENFFDSSEKTERKKYYQKKLMNLTQELENKNYEACYVEFSDSKIKKLGLRSVQVVIPKLQPIHLEEEFPCFGGERLREIPEKFGFAPAEKINQEPHPFS